MASVYFIQDGVSGLIKIGYAQRPWVRLSKMQSDSPGVLTIIALEDGGLEREVELHRQFAGHRERGEWFRPDPAILDYAKQLGAVARPRKTGKSVAFWGMTDEALSKKVSVHRATLTKIRQGRHSPTPATAIQIQRAIGMSAIKLVFGDLADEAA
jgi:DNA-binding XRE family transcriptional regulator